jgi:hypothetical protein
MTSQRRDDDAIGAYSFGVRKTAAVEQSLGRIRHRLAKGWETLQDDEIQSLAWTLGEAWAQMGFYAWDRINLGGITMDDTDQLIELGRLGRAGRLSQTAAADQAVNILNNLPEPV